MSVVLVTCTAGVLLAWYLYAFGPETPGLVTLPNEGGWLVRAVQPELAADRAGLRVDDLIVSINGRTDRNAGAEWKDLHVGKRYDVVVERQGRRETVAWTTGRQGRAYWRDPEGLARLAAIPGAALSLVLAWLIAFRRPEDSTARLGALLFAAGSVNTVYPAGAPGWFSFLAGLPAGVAIVPAGAVVFAEAASGPLAIVFAARFPRVRVKGWRLWAAVSVPAVVLLAASVARLAIRLAGGGLSQPLLRGLLLPSRLVALGCGAAFLLVLAWNYWTLSDVGERRRLRLFVVGFVLALVPVMVEGGLSTVAASGAASAQSLLLRYWLSPFSVLATVVSLSGTAAQAYAILRHRLFDVRVIVRQGLQYAAARRLLLGLAPVFAGMLVVDLALHADQSIAQAFASRGWLYAVLGATALLAHLKRDVWLAALDRRFFRERYDAQRILRSVLTEVRHAGTLDEAAPRAIQQIATALHPEHVAILLRRPGENAFRVVAASGDVLETIPSDSKLMALVRLLGKPVEVPQSETGWLKRQLPSEETRWLTSARIEWIYPVTLGENQAETVLTLGPRRSEEPYTQEDQDLIESIASGLGLLVERITTSHRSGPSGIRTAAGLPLPSIAPRYVLERELGRGGMGTVYQARDTELERAVAVKVMRQELLSSPEAVARFKREARAAAGFSHPNVVTVHDFGVADDGRAYLVMELLLGSTLRDSIRADLALAPSRAVGILRGVCAAVDAAHQRHLLHRDLKPENIFLVRGDGTEIPKVLDFGVAKLLDTADDAPTMSDTSPGVLLGTLAYLSPEQLRGGRPSPTWDLWALGVVAYEMLTGVHPFARAAEPGASAGLPTTSEPVLPPSARLGRDGVRWDAFFSRALAPNPADRPGSARELLGEIEAALGA